MCLEGVDRGESKVPKCGALPGGQRKPAQHRFLECEMHDHWKSSFIGMIVRENKPIEATQGPV